MRVIMAEQEHGNGLQAGKHICKAIAANNKYNHLKGYKFNKPGHIFVPVFTLEIMPEKPPIWKWVLPDVVLRACPERYK
jgi:hypothetical protein